jgi:hypothetical protein
MDRKFRENLFGTTVADQSYVACFGCRRYSQYCRAGSDLEPGQEISRPDRLDNHAAQIATMSQIYGESIPADVDIKSEEPQKNGP